MTIPFFFLAVSIWGALFTVNAYRPLLRQGPLSISIFFAGWLTSELPLHHIVWQIVATVVFVWAGALAAWPGWVGLGVAIASWIALARLVREAQGVEAFMARALESALGADYRSRIAPAMLERLEKTPTRFSVLRPFSMARPDVERIRDIAYGEFGRRNRLDIYRPKEASSKRPVLLQIHGGGWVIGNKEQQGLMITNYLASLGWVCVAINYRLSPRATFPDHIIDVKRAITWVKEHIADYGGDPDFIVITGGSAGGHLSSLAALTAGDPEFQPGFEGADTSVQACVPFYGVFDFTNKNGVGMRDMGPVLLERIVMKRKLSVDRRAFERASPLYRVGPSAPPFFVVHGENDVLAPAAEARHFVEALRAASTSPVLYVELPGAQHAFEVFVSLRAAHVIRAVAQWLAVLHSEHQKQLPAEVKPKALAAAS